MNRYFISLLIVSGVLLSPSFSAAEDINEIFKRVNEYITAKNFPKAIEELSWAKKEIEKLHMEKLKEFFAEDLAGYKGDKFEMNSALGILNVERVYKKGDGSSVTVSLVGGGGGAITGLAQIGRMAAMMQQGPGQDSFRIDGRTANLSTEGGSRAELSVFLEEGSILKFESSGNSDGEGLKKMAESMKVGELDKYLKGSVG